MNHISVSPPLIPYPFSLPPLTNLFERVSVRKSQLFDIVVNIYAKGRLFGGTRGYRIGYIRHRGSDVWEVRQFEIRERGSDIYMSYCVLCTVYLCAVRFALCVVCYS